MTLVLPGDEVAAGEEYLPGHGTYEKGGSIMAAVIGFLELDDREKVASVRELNPPVKLKEGDVVLGEVGQVSKAMAMVRVLAVEKGGRAPSGDTEGPIHVSRMTKRYADDARSEFKAGDIVRAKVVKAEPALQLTTEDENLGVMKARCVECRRTLILKTGVLTCPCCETVERRKLANDFARYTPSYESNKNQ